MIFIKGRLQAVTEYLTEVMLAFVVGFLYGQGVKSALLLNQDYFAP